MEILDILGSLIAAGIWVFIGIISVLAVPVAFLIALVVFPFWWIGERILRKVNHG
jgi:hypothetical protein